MKIELHYFDRKVFFDHLINEIRFDPKEYRELIVEEVEEFLLNLHRYLFEEVYFPIDNAQEDLRFFLIHQNPFDLNNKIILFFFPRKEQTTNIYFQ
jgi:hypothetical protein